MLVGTTARIILSDSTVHLQCGSFVMFCLDKCIEIQLSPSAIHLNLSLGHLDWDCVGYPLMLKLISALQGAVPAIARALWVLRLAPLCSSNINSDVYIFH